MVWWLLFGAVWFFLSLKTYYALDPKEHLQFFCFLGALPSIFFACTYRRKQFKTSASDRLSKLYEEFRNLHQDEEKKLKEFWRWMFGGLAIGWVSFLCAEALGSELFIHPAMICLYFFLPLLMGAWALERVRVIDRSLQKFLFRGVQIEQRLKQKGHHDRAYFTKKMQIGSYLPRLIPFIFIIYPLFKFGFSPLLFDRFADLRGESLFLLEILPMTTLLLIFARLILLPYFELNTISQE